MQQDTVHGFIGTTFFNVFFFSSIALKTASQKRGTLQTYFLIIHELKTFL